PTRARPTVANPAPPPPRPSRRARIVRKGPEREPPPFGRFADGDTGLVPGATYSGPGRVVVVVDDAVVGGGAVVGGVVDGVVDAGGCEVEDEPGLLVLGVVSPGAGSLNGTGACGPPTTDTGVPLGTAEGNHCDAYIGMRTQPW